MNVGRVLDARKVAREQIVEEVARVIFAGGLVIFPTDTVYGIGCDPYDLAAVDRIYGSKQRPDNKPLTFHLGSVAEFLEYARGNPLATLAARRLLPGAVTLVVRRPSFVSADVTAGLPSLGMRVPADDLASAILDRCGPLAATSANTSGQRAYRGDGNWEQLPPADLLIENGPTREQHESSVVDVTGPQAVMLREGAVNFGALNDAIGPIIRQAVKERS